MLIFCPPLATTQDLRLSADGLTEVTVNLGRTSYLS